MVTTVGHCPVLHHGLKFQLSMSYWMRMLLLLAAGCWCCCWDWDNGKVLHRLCTVTDCCVGPLVGIIMPRWILWCSISNPRYPHLFFHCCCRWCWCCRCRHCSSPMIQMQISSLIGKLCRCWWEYDDEKNDEMTINFFEAMRMMANSRSLMHRQPNVCTMHRSSCLMHHEVAIQFEPPPIGA